MAMNDHFRFIKDGSGVRIELRADPGDLEPVMTLRPGYVILGGPPPDPGTVEQGSLYFDPNTGGIKHKGAMEPWTP